VQTALQNIHTWLGTLSRIWKKQAGPSDFVWLARFRLLTIYVLLRSGLVLIVGVVGTNIETTISPSAFNVLLWTITTLSICAIALLLILGLALAGKPRPRHIGITMLCLADGCMLLAVMCACILDSLLLLLIVLAIISCSTPLFVERISRYATSYKQSKYELMSTQQKLNAFLHQYSQELAKAIQSERSSLSRELHDRLMQELSVVLLQVSCMLMRKSGDGNLQLNAEETAKLEASLRSVVTEARSMMLNLKTPQPTSVER
jgi:signal transduction histidine kinase